MDTSSELIRRNTGQFVNADFAGLAPFTENQMVEFLRKTRVRDILAPRPVLAITENQTVGHLLRLLQANSLKCAVIAKTEEIPPRATGFIDAYDIAMTALDAMGWRDISEDKVAQMILEARSFAQRDVSLIPVVSQRDPINARNSDTNLFDIAILFAGGLHRILIVDNGMMTNIISQSDIARALVSRLDLIGERARIQLKDTFLIKAQVHTISLNSRVVDALNKMRVANITGLPVVDENGRLVSSFSSSDVLNITEDTFHYTALTIQEFLTRTNGFVRPAVVSKKEDTFENLLFKFVVFGIHRVFVIDNNHMPIGLVTLTDVMGFVVSP